jgi:galactitol-specific phosphotransferase system IIC component
MIGRLLGLVLLCLLVGLFLDSLGVSARGMLDNTWATVLSVVRLGENALQWALPYTLLGAVVVVPVVVIVFALRRFRGGSGTR